MLFPETSVLAQRDAARAMELVAPYPPQMGKLMLRAIFDPSNASDGHSLAFRSIQLTVYTEVNTSGEGDWTFQSLADVFDNFSRPGLFSAYYDPSTIDNGRPGVGSSIMRFEPTDDDLRVIFAGLKAYYATKDDARGVQAHLRQYAETIAHDIAIVQEDKERVQKILAELL